MPVTTRSSWLSGTFGRALAIGGSFSLPQKITEALSLRSVHERLDDSRDDSPHEPASDLEESPLSSPLSSPRSSRPATPELSKYTPSSLPATNDLPGSTPLPLTISAPKTRRRRPRHRKHDQSSQQKSESSQQNADDRPKRKHKRSHDNRKAKRAKTSALAYSISPSLRGRVIGSAAPPLQTALVTEEMLEGSNAYLGQRRSTPPKKTWWLNEVVGEDTRWNFDLVEWDASSTIPIVANDGVVFGVLLKNPDDPSWHEKHREAAEALEERRGRLKVDKSDKKHRRGNFVAQAVGYGYGGGQEEPKNLFHDPVNRQVFDKLLALACFIRIAAYASSAFAMWAPRLYKYYADTASAIFQRFTIRPNFPSSIFASATFNFGPRTVTLPHIDFLNYALGWCAITALGHYDYKRGGHLILWDLIEFPPGSTILIPSAYLKHSNTMIQKGETRYSFTQYTAGGLFRYMEDGAQTRESMTRDQRAACIDREEMKMAEGWNMYSTLDELC